MEETIKPPGVHGCQAWHQRRLFSTCWTMTGSYLISTQTNFNFTSNENKHDPLRFPLVPAALRAPPGWGLTNSVSGVALPTDRQHQEGPSPQNMQPAVGPPAHWLPPQTPRPLAFLSSRPKRNCSRSPAGAERWLQSNLLQIICTAAEHMEAYISLW